MKIKASTAENARGNQEYCDRIFHTLRQYRFTIASMVGVEMVCRGYKD